MNKTNDEIKFLKSIKKFSKISNVNISLFFFIIFKIENIELFLFQIRQTIADSIGLSRERLSAKSFMFDSSNFQFQIDKEKFYVMDHLSLDYADKCMFTFLFSFFFLLNDFFICKTKNSLSFESKLQSKVFSVAYTHQCTNKQESR